jgi:sulfate transport system ATP-binding protein
MSITVRGVSRRFNGHAALSDVSFDAPEGSLTALLGPSGSGKTTLLRIIAGLEYADQGQVLFGGKDAAALDVRRRNIGFVFQHYALFRHMTVFDNIGFALKMRGRPRQEIRERVGELLKLIQLEDLGKRYPSQLSGGQRQRVALARALAARPAVLLLDEPFGALDARVRQELRDWLRRLHDEIHVTSVFVTHDQEEALEVSDRVVVLNRGRVEQVGTPDEVYHHPANPFVMEFLGRVNLFHGRTEDGGQAAGYARPHQLDVLREANGEPALAARVERVHAAGSQVRVDALLLGEGRRVEVLLSQERFRELRLHVGETVYVKAKEIKVFVDDYSI